MESCVRRYFITVFTHARIHLYTKCSSLKKLHLFNCRYLSNRWKKFSYGNCSIYDSRNHWITCMSHHSNTYSLRVCVCVNPPRCHSIVWSQWFPTQEGMSRSRGGSRRGTSIPALENYPSSSHRHSLGARRGGERGRGSKRERERERE